MLHTFLEFLKSFFSNLELWHEVVGGVLVMAIAGVAGFFIKKTLEGRTKKRCLESVVTTGPDSPVQVSSADGVTQDIQIDKSRREVRSAVVIERVEPGATVNINIIDYQDGIPQSAKPDVRTLFENGRVYYGKREFSQAIDMFKRCLKLETDAEKLGAINIQIGNCYYERRSYTMAEEFYKTALKEAREANDRKGEAAALASIGNSYIQRPAFDGPTRGENIRRAVKRYGEALLIFNKDEYPVDFAMTQNNLGNAYTDLPAATAEEGADNVGKAIKCYQAVLEIYKKDEYPQDYCRTTGNMGMLLALINDADACYWLREAYALREHLPDQGKRLGELIIEVCEGK